MLCMAMLASCSSGDGWDCPYQMTVNMPVYENASSDDPAILRGETTSGDQVCVLDITSTINRSILTSTGDNKFTGRLYGGSEGDKMAVFSPACKVTAYTSDTLTQTLYATDQLGTAKDIHKYLYAWAKDTLSVDYETQTSYAERTLGTITGVAKWMFTTDGVNPIKDIVSVVASTETGTMYTKRVLRMSTGGFSSSTEGSVSMKNSDGVTGVIYMSMFPTTDVQLHFSILTKSGDRYEAEQSAVTSYEKGKVYSTEVYTCTEIQKARVGDYYYSDGSTSHEYNSSRTCVGIVYALDDEDGNIDQSLTESSFGRVVAIKDLSTSTSRWSSKVLDTDIPNYTTVDGTNETAFLPFYKGQAGVFYSTENQLNLTNADNISSWPQEGCISDFDGEDHEQYFTSSSYYSAGYYCRNSGLSGLNWYLPSMGEMVMIYLLEKNGVFTHATHTPYYNLSDQAYWTSSEYDENHAWAFSCTSANIFVCYKTGSQYSRPVLKF